MLTRDEPTTGRRARPGLVVAGLALLGAVAGIVAKAADESGVGWAAQLGSDPAAWVLAVALIGRTAGTAAAAALRCAAFFAAMTLAYYAWADWVLGFGWSRALPAWLLLSVTAVAAVGVTVQWATRHPGLLPGALLALAAGVALTGGAVRGLWWTWTGVRPDGLARPVQAVADVVVVLLVVLVLPRHLRTRLWAVLVVLPMAWLADRLLDVLRQLLYLG